MQIKLSKLKLRYDTVKRQLFARDLFGDIGESRRFAKLSLANIKVEDFPKNIVQFRVCF